MSPFDHITSVLAGRAPWSFKVASAPGSKPESKTERMRNYLREHGTANAATLADEAGVPQTALVSALLKGDIDRGSVVFREGKYCWSHEFDLVLHRRLVRAAAFLRSHGYTVTKGSA